MLMKFLMVAEDSIYKSDCLPQKKKVYFWTICHFFILLSVNGESSVHSTEVNLVLDTFNW